MRLTMFHIGKLVFFDWYGFNNPNSCLLSYFNEDRNGKCKNIGFTILPLHFWNHFHFSNEEFGYDNKRFDVGLGLFSFFVDY